MHDDKMQPQTYNNLSALAKAACRSPRNPIVGCIPPIRRRLHHPCRDRPGVVCLPGRRRSLAGSTHAHAGSGYPLPLFLAELQGRRDHPRRYARRGIYYTDTRGERWSFRGFGLLDAAVYSLAISPDFARDDTVCAAAESSLYEKWGG